MHSQVLRLAELVIIDTSFFALDSTPVSANTKHNNPKSFVNNKFSKENPPRADKDCSLGVHTASIQHNEKNFDYYWGYKNHVLVDCITGLPIYELTTGADVYDGSVAVDILKNTDTFISVKECTFIADKAYDMKEIYNIVRNVYHGDCVIPLNKRNTKSQKLLPIGNPVCEAGFAMHKDGKAKDNSRTRQKYCCPFRPSKDFDCPCNHKNWNNGKKNRGCTKYITIPDDYRLAVDRNSIEFKSNYNLRTEAERYNSRFKSIGQERLWVRNGNSAKNLNTVAHISLLAIALAAVITNSNSSYRSFKNCKRTA